MLKEIWVPASLGTLKTFLSKPLANWHHLKLSQKFFKLLLTNNGCKISCKINFYILSKQYPGMKFVYSLASHCVNLPDQSSVQEYECQHAEADTTIYLSTQRSDFLEIRQQLWLMQKTDILVEVTYGAQAMEGTMDVKCKKGILACRAMCSDEKTKIIIPLHVYNGCDTTSTIFGHENTLFYENVCSSE